MTRTIHSNVARRETRGLLLELHGRIQYALLMGSLVALALTGLPQKLDSLDLSLWLMDAAGGIETVRLIHRAAGGVLVFAALYHLVLASLTVLALRAMRPLAMAPDLKDIRDAWQMVRYFFGLRHDRVTFARPSYLEKTDYLVIAWGVAVMVVSGVMFLFPVRISRVLSGDAVIAGLQVHSDSSILVVAWVVLVHFAYRRLAPSLFPSRTSPVVVNTAHLRAETRLAPETAPAGTATATPRDRGGSLAAVVPEVELDPRPQEAPGLSDKPEVGR